MTPSVTLAQIDEQRLRGWVEFHPEDYCHRCGGRNVKSWHAPSPLWNAVMRAGPGGVEPWQGIVCPQCFVELAELHGIATDSWCLRVHAMPDWWPTTDGVGRTWDATLCLWVEP